MKGRPKSQKNENGVAPHIKRLAKHFALSPQDRQTLAELARHRVAVSRGHIFKRYLDPEPDAVLLIQGLAARVRETEDGDRRLIGLLLPGEMSFSQNGSSSRANYELVAMTQSEVALVPHCQIRKLESLHPRLTKFLGWKTQREIDALRDLMVKLLSGNVEDRLLHLFESLYDRLDEIDGVDDGRMRIPMTQADIADAIGASLVHVSKTLSRLAREGRLKTKRRSGAMDVKLLRRAAQIEHSVSNN